MQNIDWSFQICFRLSQETWRFARGESILLEEGPPPVTLIGVGGPERPSYLRASEGLQYRDVAVIGAGYVDEDSASFAGLRWMDALRKYFVSFMVRADLGDPVKQDAKRGSIDGSLGGYPAIPLGLSLGRGIDWGRRPCGPSRSTSCRISPASQAGQAIAEFANTGVTLSHSQRTAAALFSAALGIDDPEARFVMLVSSIEHVLHRELRSSEAAQLIDTLIDQVENSALASDEARSLKSGLHGLREESITQAGARFVADIEFLPGEREQPSVPRDPVKYWKACYRLRGSIAHGPKRQAYNPDQVDKLLYGLDYFAGRVLHKSFFGAI